MSDRTQVNPEIEALRSIEATVLPLDLDTRERIVRWLTSHNESDRFWQLEGERQRLVEQDIDLEAIRSFRSPDPSVLRTHRNA